jgi:hypothetical protein
MYASKTMTMQLIALSEVGVPAGSCDATLLDAEMLLTSTRAPLTGDV